MDGARITSGQKEVVEQRQCISTMDFIANTRPGVLLVFYEL